MKLNTVHVDIVSEEKEFMALISWRQFWYIAVVGITVYNIARWWLEGNFSFDQIILVGIILVAPAVIIVYILAFVHLEEPDMYVDRYLWYTLIGKKEKGIYRYKEEDELE